VLAPPIPTEPKVAVCGQVFCECPWIAELARLHRLLQFYIPNPLMLQLGETACEINDVA